MEGKKRNKKNKNKQAKEATNEAAASGSAKTPASLQGSNHEPVPEKNHHSQYPGDSGCQECGPLESEVNQGTQNVPPNQVDVDDRLKAMQCEINSCIQKEADVDGKLNILQNEINSCIQKEDSLENRVQHLLNDCGSFSEEKNSTKEMIGRMDDTNMMLLKRVLELEESRDTLIQENERLSKCFTALETRILQREENASFTSSSVELVKNLLEDKNLLNRMVTVRGTAEEMILENAEIVKKVNEPYDEPNYRNDATNLTLESKINSKPSPNENTSITSHLLESYSGRAVPLQNSPGSVLIDNVATNGAFLYEMPLSAEGNANLESSQQPLDEIQTEESNTRTMEVNEKPAVPLTDAPLIGAPFRLISYVANYVSGADLVDGKNSTLRS